MKPIQDPLPYLLESSSVAEFRYRLSVSPTELNLLQIQKLRQHLAAFDEPAIPLRLGVVHTYTSDLLDPWFHFEAQLQGLKAEIHHAPYGFTEQAALPSSDLAAFSPDVTLLLMCWEDLHPDLSRPLSGFDAEGRSRVAAEVVQNLTGLVSRFRSTVPGQIIATLLPPLMSPGLGEYDIQSDASETAWRASVKAALAGRLRSELPSTALLDLDESLLHLGRQRFFDLRLWYSSRFPFTSLAARELARRVTAIGAVTKLPKAKVIVLDADNTLWGGIVGEDGVHGIALGPDYPGNAFVAFQRRLLDFQQRGFVLALCSKNNPDDLLEVLREHPHQLLREHHFAALRVNWEPKPQNLRSLAAELNVGLDSFIFVDDSDHECLAVRTDLPHVEVVKTPSRPLDVPYCLDRVGRLEVLTLTEEDRQKTRLYVQQRQRRELAEGSSDLRGYLASLDMKMRIRLDDVTALARLAQLTQKTNQFNLTTRRYSEAEIRVLIEAKDWMVAHFSLADVFGDNGIVGLALIRLGSDGRSELDTLLMSCRVIGRKAESAFLDALLRTLQEKGVRHLRAQYLPTSKNKLVESFLPDHEFILADDGSYLRDLATSPPKAEDAYPIRIEMG